MKKILLLCVLCVLSRPNHAADARVINEGGTNILALGVDSGDYDVVRIYLRGSNVLEFRADDIIHRERKVIVPGRPPEKEAERDALLAAIRAQTNVTALNAPLVLSNLTRLNLLEVEAADERKKVKEARPLR